jgi:hypothetical protein
MTGYWTDYPIKQLGDEPHKMAPVRQCELLSYDGDKYVAVLVDGIEATFKAGYLYTAPGRAGEVPAVSRAALSAIEKGEEA